MCLLGGSSGGESVTIDPTELARLQQSWTDKAKHELRKKSAKEDAGDAYSRSDGRHRGDKSERDRDRDSERSRYERDKRGDKDKGGRSGRTPDKPDKPGDRPRKETGRRTGSPDGKGRPPVTPVGKRTQQKGTKAVGSSNDRVDYTRKGFFKLGGGRFFERAACVDVLVKEYSFAREKATKMCFECGLSDFDDCAMCPTPAKKGHTTKTDDFHDFPDDFHVVCRKLVQ